MDFIVNVDVDDLARAESFYREAFGLRAGRRSGTDALEMLGGPAPLWLLCKAAGSPPGAGIARPRDYGRHWTPVHLDFIVDDIGAAVARAVAAGARAEQEISDHAWGRMALMADPFGNGFCLIEFLNGGYDVFATPQTPASPSAP